MVKMEDFSLNKLYLPNLNKNKQLNFCEGKYRHVSLKKCKSLQAL